MSCHLGSFKLYNGTGTAHFKFKGSFLLAYLNGSVTVTGNVKKEYPSPAQAAKLKNPNIRQAYFGDGEITIKGNFKSVQWFGRDLAGEWTGAGGLRLYGDYDKNMETGWYWYGDDVAHRNPWTVSSGDLFLPKFGSDVAKPVLKG